MKKTITQIIKVVLPLFIGVYLMWYFYDAMDEQAKTQFYRVIDEADYFWIILSLFFGIASHLSRAWRQKYLLEPLGYTTKFSNRYHSMMIGYLINLLIPRAGEAARAGALYSSENVPFSKTFGAIIAERVFDLVMLGIVVLITLSISGDELMIIKNSIVNPPVAEGEKGFPWMMVLGGAAFLGAIAFVVLWFKNEAFKNKFVNFVKEVITGVFGIFKSKNPGAFIFHTLLIWVNYIIFFAICFNALPETSDFPVSGLLIGFIAGTVGIAFTNGGIGAYPLLVGIVVNFYLGQQLGDGAKGVGEALGMLIWSSQTLMMIILGLISFIIIPRKFKKQEQDARNEG